MKRLLFFTGTMVLAIFVIIYVPKLYFYGVLLCLLFVFLSSWLPRRFQGQDQTSEMFSHSLSKDLVLIILAYLTAGLLKILLY